MTSIKKEAAKATSGTAVTVAHLAKFATAKSGAEFLRLLCRILGFALPLPVAAAIRIILLASSGWAAIDGISKLCPELARKLRKEEPSYV